MRRFLWFTLALLLFWVAMLCTPEAFAASTASITPHEIQAQIASGHPDVAVKQLQPILAENPRSAVAWYLNAEALDASGHTASAAAALTKAENLDPAMPFAQPSKLSLLEQRLHVANVQDARRRHTVFAVLSMFYLVLLIGFIALAAYLWNVNRGRRKKVMKDIQDLKIRLQALLESVSNLLDELALQDKDQVVAKCVEELTGIKSLCTQRILSLSQLPGREHIATLVRAAAMASYDVKMMEDSLKHLSTTIKNQALSRSGLTSATYVSPPVVESHAGEKLDHYDSFDRRNHHKRKHHDSYRETGATTGRVSGVDHNPSNTPKPTGDSYVTLVEAPAAPTGNGFLDGVIAAEMIDSFNRPVQETVVFERTPDPEPTSYRDFSDSVDTGLSGGADSFSDVLSSVPDMDSFSSGADSGLSGDTNSWN